MGSEMVVRVAVIGGGAAGMAAASRVKRLLREKAEVVVFEKGRWVSFALCGTPYYIAGKVENLEDLVHYPLEEFTQKRGIKVFLKSEVYDISLGDRVIHWRSGEDKGSYEYDYLVIATGAKPIAPKEWLRFRNVFTLHSLDDAKRIRNYISSRQVRRVAVVGLGYVGYELAECLKHIGKEVIAIEAYNRPLPRTLDEDLSEYVVSSMQEGGVELMLGSRVVAIEGKEDIAKEVILEKGESVQADAMVLAIGIRPNVELAKAAGLKLGSTGALWVDDRLRTSAKDVYAAGDVAETRDLVTGDRVWCPFAQVANKMGYVAGSNISGMEMRFPGVVGTRVTSAFGIVVAVTGLSEEEAVSKGFDVVSVVIKARSKPRYIAGGREEVIKVIADRGEGRLLGAQGVGGEATFWRINIIAALLMKRGKVEDLFYGDWGYMPLLSRAWDPLVIAARRLFREVGRC